MGVKSNVQGISIAPLKTALQYADSKLGITVATSSYGEICDALGTYFYNPTGWLYDEGYEYVPWQVNYAYQSSASNLRSGFTKTSSSMVGAISALNANSTETTANTQNKINFSNYSQVHITTDHGTYNINCSTWGNAYLTFRLERYDNKYYFLLLATNNIRPLEYPRIGEYTFYAGLASGYNAVIQKVWLT